MMTKPAPDSPTLTFVLRFWREWSAAGPQWRGRIEHVSSGKSVAFLEPDRMLAFLRDYGVMAQEDAGMANGDPRRAEVEGRKRMNEEER